MKVTTDGIHEWTIIGIEYYPANNPADNIGELYTLKTEEGQDILVGFFEEKAHVEIPSEGRKYSGCEDATRVLEATRTLVKQGQS